MSRAPVHREHHLIGRVNWLRAAVLGANDGIVSTACLILGVAAASPDKGAIALAGIAGLVAGAMSMATGEYVSVSSQSDTEKADMAREARELDTDIDSERRELAGIYESRGLSSDLARQVALQLMDKDALAAHARDELGISPATAARPIQAALASASSFSVGAALPLAGAVLAPAALIEPIVAGASLLSLAALGAAGARAGGAPPSKAAIRVTVWSALAMAVTSGIGAVAGHVLG